MILFIRVNLQFNKGITNGVWFFIKAFKIFKMQRLSQYILKSVLNYFFVFFIFSLTLTCFSFGKEKQDISVLQSYASFEEAHRLALVKQELFLGSSFIVSSILNLSLLETSNNSFIELSFITLGIIYILRAKFKYEQRTDLEKKLTFDALKNTAKKENLNLKINASIHVLLGLLCILVGDSFDENYQVRGLGVMTLLTGGYFLLLKSPYTKLIEHYQQEKYQSYSSQSKHNYRFLATKNNVSKYVGGNLSKNNPLIAMENRWIAAVEIKF